MFWGLVLEPGKRYSTTVDKSFHVSMAALDCSSVKSDSEILSVVLECDGQENILCNLTKQQKLLQSNLDLNFMTGDKVSFEVKGNGVIHLSGYLVPEDDEDYMNMYENDDIAEDEEVEEEEEEESPKKNEKSKGKRKSETVQSNNVKKQKVTEDSDEDSNEDDEDFDDELEALNALNTSDLAADSDDDDDDDDEDDEDEEDSEDEDNSDEEDDEEGLEDSDEELEIPPTKKQQKTPQSTKKQQQTPNNKQTPKQQQQSANKQNATTPLVNGSGPNQQQFGKKNKKGQETPKGQAPQTPNQNSAKGKNQKTPGGEAGTPQQKKILEGGVMIKDVREGTGPVAKNGQMVQVFYQGRLKNNNKMFDECRKSGPPFKFRLGKGEVIKGWDIGVSGMKVGGLRTITCPPNMAYGQKGSPPQIPANSTLVFQVELKGVN